MRSKNVLGLGIGALALAASSAFAAPLFITNASFETNVLTTDGDYLNGTIASWTGSAYGTQNPTSSLFTGAGGNFLPATATGANVGYTNSAGGGTNPQTATSSTVLVSDGGASATVADNTIYTLTVAIGARLDYAHYSDAKIEILVNGASEAVITILGTALPVGTFSDYTTTFTTAPSGDLRVGNTLTVRITGTNPGDPTLTQLNFDNVRLDATDVVPEPASMGLLGLAGISLLARRRR